MQSRYMKFIIPTVLIILLAASLAGNIILAAQMKAMKITDYLGAGLVGLKASEVKEISVSHGGNPYWSGVVEDPELVETVCAMLRSGCYQAAPSIGTNRNPNPGDGAYPSAILETEEHRYVLIVAMDRIEIYVDGEVQCYFTDFQTELRAVLSGAAQEHFETEG